MVSVAGVDHAPATTFAMEASTLASVPQISVPVSGSIPVQLDSASDGELESPPAVSDHAVLTIVAANYWLSSRRVWPPTVQHCLKP